MLFLSLFLVSTVISSCSVLFVPFSRKCKLWNNSSFPQQWIWLWKGRKFLLPKQWSCSIWIPKTKGKQIFILFFAFWQINAKTSWKINYGSLFQLYQETKLSVYMCWHWIKSFDTLIAEYQLHVSALMP